MNNKIRRWLNNLKRRWSQERCYTRMEYANKAAMGCCSGYHVSSSDESIEVLWGQCSNCRHLIYMDQKCDTCANHKTMACPNSSRCYSLKNKPFWIAKRLVKGVGEINREVKVLRCPDCERKFSVTDTIKVKGGLVFCPNCEVELKPILLGLTPSLMIIDEFCTDERRMKNG